MGGVKGKAAQRIWRSIYGVAAALEPLPAQPGTPAHGPCSSTIAGLGPVRREVAESASLGTRRSSAERLAEAEHAPLAAQRAGNDQAPATRCRGARPCLKPAGTVPSQSVGAAIGFTPDRSSRRTRIVTSVMTSASAMIPAATMYPWENPVARA